MPWSVFVSSERGVGPHTSQRFLRRFGVETTGQILSVCRYITSVAEGKFDVSWTERMARKRLGLAGERSRAREIFGFPGLLTDAYACINHAIIAVSERCITTNAH